MTLSDGLNLIMRLSFIALAVLTLVDYLRRRNQTRLDIHLMFASVATLMIVQLVTQVTGISLPWLNTVSLAMLMAQPYLLLRLVEHHSEIPLTVTRPALAGMITSVALVIYSRSPYPDFVFAVMVIYFVLVEGYAAWLLVQGTIKSRGVTHNRLLLASLGSFGMALALLLVGISALVGMPVVSRVMGQLVQLLAVFSALSYYGGFAPPAWLLSHWRLTELQLFLSDTTGKALLGETDKVLERLCLTAMRSTDGIGALVTGLDDRDRRYWVRATSDAKRFAGIEAVDPGVITQTWDQRSQALLSNPSKLGATDMRLVGALRANALLTVPIASHDRIWGGIIVFLRREPLFADDSLLMLALFADQAALSLAYADGIAEQQALVNQLRESNIQLARGTQMKSEFLANMSHELRTPLNAIIGFTELMHDGAVGPVSAEHKEYLGDVLTSAHHLLKIINDILDLAKVEAGKMEFRPEPVVIAALVEEGRDILRTISMQKKVVVKVDVDPTVDQAVIDPAKFKQILYNYLSNALKFTPEEGTVTIRIQPEPAAAFRLEVEDTGIGISPDHIGELFQEFKQLDSGKRRQFQGTGLGLALTKRIAEAQGGRVGVESTIGRGSRFYAVLPLRPLDQAERIPSTYSHPPEPIPGAPTILVVEDEQKDVDWLVHTLSESGYTVDIAMTGAEAVAKLSTQPYAAVTLDLLLPDVSGLDVLREIRRRAVNPDMPVVLVTVVAEKGLVSGFRVHDHLVKPLEPQDLLTSLKRAGVPPTPGTTVLVVDDDPVSLRLMDAALAQIGCQSVCRSSGEAGLLAVTEFLPDAIILDLTMPEMDGFGFLAHLRATPGGSKVPVIVWTSRDLSAEEREVLRSPAQAVVLKGQGRMDLLLNELRSALGPAVK